MLKKFTNNEMSSNEVDSMMEDFFKEKDENEFRKRWNKILDDGKPEYKIIKFFRNNLYTAVSAASIILLIGFGGLYFISKNINTNVQYTDVIKGNTAMKTKLNKLVSNISVVIGDESIVETKAVFELYKTNQDKRVIDTVTDKIKSNSKLSEDMFWMAGLSAIKMENYTEAKNFLGKINSTSLKYNKSKELLVIIEDILK